MAKTLDDKTLVSEQIHPADVAAFKAQGVTMIVCNRPDGEAPDQPTGREIEAACKEAGIDFRYVRIARGIGPSEVEKMREAIEATGDGKMLAYCRTGTRSSLVWATAKNDLGESVESLDQKVSAAGYSLDPVRHLLD